MPTNANQTYCGDNLTIYTIPNYVVHDVNIIYVNYISIKNKIKNKQIRLLSNIQTDKNFAPVDSCGVWYPLL